MDGTRTTHQNRHVAGSCEEPNYSTEETLEAYPQKPWMKTVLWSRQMLLFANQAMQLKIAFFAPFCSNCAVFLKTGWCFLSCAPWKLNYVFKLCDACLQPCVQLTLSLAPQLNKIQTGTPLCLKRFETANLNLNSAQQFYSPCCIWRLCFILKSTKLSKKNERTKCGI